MAEGKVGAATLRTIKQSGKQGTPLAEAALVLARRLDNGSDDTASALATAAKQLQATLAELMRDVKVETTPVDELRARRDAKLGSA